MPGELAGTAPSSADPRQRTAPRHRAAWLAEVALIVAFDVTYEWLRSIRSAAPAVATERARSVLAIERWLHVAVEQRMNEFTTAHTWLASGAGYYYGTLHFVVTPAVMIWLWRRRQESYETWRTVLALATTGALVTYLLFPVAPPRLALPGFTDTLIASHVFGAGDPHGVSGLINMYAAMPSLHVGWAFWVALAVFNSRSGRFRWLAWLYPMVTTAVVMATANHFLLDGAAGSAYVASAYAIMRANRARSARHMPKIGNCELEPVGEITGRADPGRRADATRGRSSKLRVTSDPTLQSCAPATSPATTRSTWQQP
jgi:hypothetical protein